MSIPSVSPVSIQETTLLRSLNANTTKAAAPSASVPKAAIPSAAAADIAIRDAASGSSSAVLSLTKDFTSLLKSLAGGDVTGAKSDLVKLQANLQSQNASSSDKNVSSDTATVTTSKSVDKLVSEISNSLLNGSTSGALQDLASYLVTTGFGTGSLVNTTA